MNVLVIGNRVPWPLHDGGAIATFYMLKGLSENGIKVTYLTLNPVKHFISEEEILQNLPFCEVITQKVDTTISPIKALINLLKGGSYHIERFTPKPFFQLIKSTILKNNFDIIHFENLFSAGFAKEIKSFSKAPLVLRQHNVESAIWEKMASNSNNPIIKIYLNIQAKRLKKFEQLILPFFDTVIPITKTDENVFNSWNSTVRYQTIPAGIPVKDKPKTNGNLNQIYHIGSMEWLPNKQGVEWFIEKVWPIVQSKNKQITFHFAGKKLDKNWNHNPANGIFNHGETNNALQFMSENGAMIVPLLSGSGIRIKTLEAMSIGKAVISTSIGAAGLDVENGKNISIANLPEDFADAVLKMTISENYHQISDNASALVRNNFYYITTANEFNKLYNKLLGIS